jgi:hypothetical protein
MPHSLEHLRDMDVTNRAHSSRLIGLVAALHLVIGAQALADPDYTAIDLGPVTSTYGLESSGNGTITGTNGLTYTFNPVQNDLPAQWQNTTQGVPILGAAPSWSPPGFANPNNIYSYSYLNFSVMNSQGLAAGISQYGVYGYLGYSEAFLTQQQPNDSWGAPISIWPGAQTYGGTLPTNIGIWGISPNGQVLGYGPSNPDGPSANILYLYDSKTQTLTNLTSLINSIKWTNSTNLPVGQYPTWIFGNATAQLDSDGRILVQANQGSLTGPEHNLLLIPAGVSADPLAVPEPASWAMFATLIGGWMAHQRLRSRARR